MNYFLSSLIAFLLGSIPTAYIIVKKFLNLDITKAGSGNVGTLNSYEVSNSKLIGLSVLLIDFTKGWLSIFLVKFFFGNNFFYIALAFFFSVFAHCFSPWLKFKGGRGLATAAGAASIFIPVVLFLWIGFWLILKYLKKDIHFANVFATLLIIIVSFAIPEFVNKYSFPKAETNLLLSFTISLTMIIVLIKHWEPIKDYYKHKIGI